LTEFELIARYFTRPVRERQGIGDDCALIDVGDRTLAITSDLLVEHTHFFPDVDPAALGHKALAVNLSDLAAAGAQPRCFLLSLSVLPRPRDASWSEAIRRARPASRISLARSRCASRPWARSSALRYAGAAVHARAMTCGFRASWAMLRWRWRTVWAWCS
jgi:hypothetical protein